MTGTHAPIRASGRVRVRVTSLMEGVGVGVKGTKGGFRAGGNHEQEGMTYTPPTYTGPVVAMSRKAAAGM